MTTMSDTRTEIMDAFADQLATDGYQGISLIAVARTAGIRKPSIYHHFPGGKEELYTAVALRFISELRERIVSALDPSAPLEDALIALGDAVADESARSITVEQRIYDALDHVAEDTRTTVSTDYVSNILDPVRELFSRAVDAGDISGDPWFLMNCFLHLARSTDPHGTPSHVPPVVSLFLDGARPR